MKKNLFKVVAMLMSLTFAMSVNVMAADNSASGGVQYVDFTTEYTLGDVDANEQINATDALLALKHASRLSILEGNLFNAADVDRNDVVDSKDALYILQYAAKLRVRFAFNTAENFEALKDCVISNSTLDSDGIYNYEDSYAEDGMTSTVTIKYDESTNIYSFKFDTKYEYDQISNFISLGVELGTENSVIKAIYNETTNEQKRRIDLECSIENGKVHFGEDFSKVVKKNKFANELLYNATDNDKIQFTNDNQAYINALLHLALVSMDSYFQEYFKISLNDLGFSLYSYSDDDLLEIFMPIENIDSVIVESLDELAEFIKKNGIRDDEWICLYGADDYFNNGTVRDNYCGCESYVIYDEEIDAVYFDGYAYFTNNTVVYISMIPDSSRETYIYASVMKPDTNYDYQVVAEYHTIINSRDLKYHAEYDYEVISEVDSSNRSSFTKLIDTSVFEIIRQSDKTISKIYNYSGFKLKNLGYINY